MPTPKSLSDYPSEYGASILQACRGRVEIPCESPNEAQLLRSRLYAFRQAIYDSPYTMPRLTLVAGMVKFYIIKNTLILERKNTLEDRISDALKQTRTEVPTVSRQLNAHDSEDMQSEILP